MIPRFARCHQASWMAGSRAGPHAPTAPHKNSAPKTTNSESKFFFAAQMLARRLDRRRPRAPARRCEEEPAQQGLVTALVVILVVFLVVILVFFLVQTGFLKRKRGGKKMTGVDDLVRTSSA